MTETAIFKYVRGADLDKGAVDYGFTDKQGRKVGYSWHIYAVEYVRTDSEYGYRLAIDAPRHTIEMQGCPTRDGRRYGPSARTNEYATLEAARRAAVKRVEAAQKRDIKKFSKEEA